MVIIKLTFSPIPFTNTAFIYSQIHLLLLITCIITGTTGIYQLRKKFHHIMCYPLMLNHQFSSQLNNPPEQFMMIKAEGKQHVLPR